MGVLEEGGRWVGPRVELGQGRLGRSARAEQQERVGVGDWEQSRNGSGGVSLAERQQKEGLGLA